jgi:hypothetical protein
VRLPERDSPSCQEVRELRRQREAAGLLRHASTVEGGRAKHLWKHREYAEDRIHGVEEGLFILLEVLRVA